MKANLLRLAVVLSLGSTLAATGCSKLPTSTGAGGGPSGGNASIARLIVTAQNVPATVTQPPPSDAAAAGLVTSVGAELPLKVVAVLSDNTTMDLPAGASVVSWTSSDNGKAAVDASGTLDPKAPGTVTVTANVSGVDGAQSATGTVTITND